MRKWGVGARPRTNLISLWQSPEIRAPSGGLRAAELVWPPPRQPRPDLGRGRGSSTWILPNAGRPDPAARARAARRPPRSPLGEKGKVIAVNLNGVRSTTEIYLRSGQSFF